MQQLQQAGGAARADAAVIDGAKLIPLAIWIKRLFAVALWLVSVNGTFVQVLSRLDGTEIGLIIIYTIIWQLGFSAAQFALRHQWQSVWYAGALSGSVVPSVMTYGPLVTPDWIFAWEPTLTHTPAMILAWAIVAGVMTLIDIIPEQILVRR